jgi:hypothetical protein
MLGGRSATTGVLGAKIIPSGVHCVLTDPPESVATSKHSSSEKRRVLTRVSPEDYSVLDAARSNKEPTEKDLLALANALDNVFETAP